MMYFPPWILYWLYFVLMANFFSKFIFLGITVLICSKFIRQDKLTKTSIVARGWCFSVIFEILSLGISYLAETNVSNYYNYYTFFSALCFTAATVPAFLLNYFLTFRKAGLSKKQRLIFTASITLASAPYWYFIPAGI